LVDRRVLLDVEVLLRDVRLGLVVVVVGDEVLDRVLREELAELVAELRRQRLVVGDHESRPLHLLDRERHRGRLARARDPEQRLEPLAGGESLSETIPSLRLIGYWRICRVDLELRHGQRKLAAVAASLWPISARALLRNAFCRRRACSARRARMRASLGMGCPWWRRSCAGRRPRSPTCRRCPRPRCTPRWPAPCCRCSGRSGSAGTRSRRRC